MVARRPLQNQHPKRQTLSATGMSIGIHGLFLILAIIGLTSASKGGFSEEAGREVSVVLIRETATEQEYLTEEDFQQETFSEETQTQSIQEVTPLSKQSNLVGILPKASESNEGDLSDILPDLSKAISRNGQTKLPDGSVKVGIFGTQGVGSRFAFVFDRSGSMGVNLAMEAAKAELKKGLSQLEETHQFQIMFYNTETEVFDPKGLTSTAGLSPTLVYATEANTQLAEKFIRRIQPLGATNHRQAIDRALAFGPDVIFFLTDGTEPQISSEALAQIRRDNRSAATINTIEFGVKAAPASRNFLVDLAEQNDGEYTYIQVSTIKLSRQ
ncbi:MAG: hypothetical protein MPJ24_09980 [Pirellulaceae bacterium]|nr:hypothetical protein [Pirellulaceae bacterium]